MRKIHTSNRPSKIFIISCGCFQLLVGPACSCFSEHMYVCFSTLATSSGSERAKKEFSRFASLTNEPCATKVSVISVYSSSLPVTTLMLSGFKCLAFSVTHCATFWLWERRERLELLRKIEAEDENL